MEDSNRNAFSHLFTAACKKCFGHEKQSMLSVEESRLLSSCVFDNTGLNVAPERLEHFSMLVLEKKPASLETPDEQVADDLACFVLNMPVLPQTTGRGNAQMYPYWYLYCNSTVISESTERTPPVAAQLQESKQDVSGNNLQFPTSKIFWYIVFFVIAVILITSIFLVPYLLVKQ